MPIVFLNECQYCHGTPNAGSSCPFCGASSPADLEPTLRNPSKPPMRIGGYRQLTAETLIEILAAYPPNTPIFTAHDRELFAHTITELKLDDWEDTTVDAEGSETPGVIVGLHLGPRS